MPRSPMQRINNVAVRSKHDAVRLLLAAHDFDIQDVDPETVAYWLASDYDALKIASILLGCEDRPEAVLTERM